MTGLVILAATFALVFLRAIQQLNVVHHNITLAAITSYLIAAAGVSELLLVIDQGWTSIPWVGTGGALGVVAAMITHKKLREILS